jgi:hypothetical protein
MRPKVKNIKKKKDKKINLFSINILILFKFFFALKSEEACFFDRSEYSKKFLIK